MPTRPADHLPAAPQRAVSKMFKGRLYLRRRLLIEAAGAGPVLAEALGEDSTAYDGSNYPTDAFFDRLVEAIRATGAAGFAMRTDGDTPEQYVDASLAALLSAAHPGLRTVGPGEVRGMFYREEDTGALTLNHARLARTGVSPPVLLDYFERVAFVESCARRSRRP